MNLFRCFDCITFVLVNSCPCIWHLWKDSQARKIFERENEPIEKLHTESSANKEVADHKDDNNSISISINNLLKSEDEFKPKNDIKEINENKENNKIDNNYAATNHKPLTVILVWRILILMKLKIITSFLSFENNNKSNSE